MKLSSRKQVEKLSRFQSENFLTTSFYFDTDKSRMRKKEIALSLKNLLNTSKTRIEQMEVSKKKRIRSLKTWRKSSIFAHKIFP